MAASKHTSREIPYIFAALCAACTLWAAILTGPSGALGVAALCGSGLALLCALVLCLRPWAIGRRRAIDTIAVAGLLLALAGSIGAGLWTLGLLVLATLMTDAFRLRTRMQVTVPRNN